MNAPTAILSPRPRTRWDDRSKETTGKCEWLTPPDLIRSLGAFDLDPCSPFVRPWDTAKEHMTVFDDGLLQPWHGRVWLNPPFGPNAGKWVGKLARHGDGIALLPARTETRMFFEHVWPRAHAVLFLRGRIKFHHVSGAQAEHSVGAPVCLIAYGERNAQALEGIVERGKLVSLRAKAAGGAR